jgi:hypothetical protein
MQPEGATDPSLNISDDPTICERAFKAAYIGETGLSSVRSLAMMSPSAKQATADWAEYRKLLIQNGWEEVGQQPVAEEATVFFGSDARSGIYTVQHLFRRDNVVGIIEATGPAMAHSPEIILELVRVVDQRIAGLKSSYGSSIRVGSAWPIVAAPTIVADANLSGAPLIGQSVQLGGLSGLAALDAFGTEFVAVTDHGPTSQLESSNGDLLVMPLPAYTPSIVKLQLDNNQLKVTERIGLRLQGGFTNARTGTPFVTGLPNSESDPAAFDQTGRNTWGTDPNGVDPEGLAIDPRDGSYWIADEYGPSILHVAPDGTILARYLPAGKTLDAPGQNVRDILPAELARRKALRGFEGVAISPDGARLFAMMQAPLSDPNEAAGESSRNVRLLTLDLSGPEPVVDGLYIYETEPYSSAGTFTQENVRVSDLTAVSATRLVAIEHESLDGGGFKMAYRVDLDRATNILGRTDFGGGTLEQAADLAALDIAPTDKLPIANLANLGWQRDAIEGVAMIDDSTIAVVSDNNFGFGGYDRAGRLLANGTPTRLSIVHLPGSLR